MTRLGALSFGAFLAMTASLPSAHAANDVWDGNGNVPPSNNWSFDPSWVDNSSPGNADTATFNIADTYTVSFSVTNLDAIQALTVSSGHVTFASTSSTARTLPVNSATGTQDVLVTGSSTFLILGASPSNDVNIIAGDDLSVQSDAVLFAQFGNDITASDLSASGLNGTIVIDGSGSKLTLTGAGINNFIGRSGNTGDLAFQSGSTGNSIAGNLGIADSGTTGSQGFVTVLSGATVSLAGNLTMANQNVVGQSAELAIEGTNSALTQTGASTITVGAAANGTASIHIGVNTTGGTLTTGTGQLTVNPTGTVTIGNSVNNTGTLNTNGDVLVNGGAVHVDGGTFLVAPTKTMTIQNGGLFDVAGFYHADAAFVVTGAGSAWTNSTSLTIGAVGTGSLMISAGGSVSDTSGTVGLTSGSNGTVTVTGTGSTWTNNGSLSVGGQGTGSLTISSHGTVSNTQGSVSGVGGGTVTVTGAGSTWTNSSNLDVGTFGTGSLTIELGGSVSSGGTESHVGLAAGSNGTVTVADPGSTWTLNSDFTVGDSGTGRLNILKGGTVSNAASVIGFGPGSDGSVTVDGGGSKWTNTGSVTIGLAQLGRMTISAGGAVSDTIGVIGRLRGDTAGDGAVTVTGSNSVWTNSSDLFVGLSATGALSVESGATVSDAIGYVGANSSSHGTATVTGSGSTWTSSSMAIGGSPTQSGGTGSLTVSGGGLVRVNGSTIVWANGTVDVQSGGTFNANDNFTIDAGVLTRASSGSFNLAASKTMTIQNGGRASFTGGYTTASNATYHVTGGRLETLTGSIVVGNGAQLNVDSGGTVSSATFLDVGTTGGDGTLTVTGSSSSAITAAPSLTFWGTDSHAAHVTFSNNATGSFPGGISVAANGAPSTTVDVHILSGADLTLTTLFLDSNGGTNSSVAMTVDGAGSSVTQTSNSMLTVGSFSTGKASLVVRNNALFTTGTSSIFVAPTGTVELNSGAVLDARGPVTMSGTFNFLGGTLHVDNYTGDLDNQGGTLAPGHSAGNTNISGTYKQQSSSTLQIEIGGTTPSTTFDTLHIGGATVLAGTLNVSLLGGFTPSAGNTFQIITAAGGIGGRFTSAVLPALTGLVWQLDYQPNAISLFVAIPGDYNHNGTVDAADYVLWRKTLGQTGTGLAADGNGNGTIDQGDFDVWRAHFGQTAGSGSGVSANTAVPEPASSALLVFAVAGLCLPRRRAA